MGCVIKSETKLQKMYMFYFVLCVFFGRSKKRAVYLAGAEVKMCV
jgi:hypothetical protein